jgi:hypothetical protein
VTRLLRSPPHLVADASRRLLLATARMSPPGAYPPLRHGRFVRYRAVCNDYRYVQPPDTLVREFSELKIPLRFSRGGAPN